MMRLIAIVAAFASIRAFAVEDAKAFETKEQAEKTCVAPDGVNVITERTDGLGCKTYSTTLSHVCDCGLVNCVVMTNDTSKSKGQNVIEHKVRSPLGKEIDQLKRKCGIFTQVVGKNLYAFESMLTNLVARVELLEEIEFYRTKQVEEVKARREERKQKLETKKDAHQTLQEVIRRGRRVEKKEAK